MYQRFAINILTHKHFQYTTPKVLGYDIKTLKYHNPYTTDELIQIDSLSILAIKEIINHKIPFIIDDINTYYGYFENEYNSRILTTHPVEFLQEQKNLYTINQILKPK